MNHYGDLLPGLLETAREAGAAALAVYRTDFGVDYKDDRSPVTEADRRSHEVIKRALAALAPDIPVLSEEGRSAPYEERRPWRSFFLVDPLDGTKEFIKRNGEFTVNIALVEDGGPALGVIYVPVLDLMYYGARGMGAWRSSGGGEPRRIRCGRGPGPGGLVVAASRSHPSPELEAFLSRFRVRERLSRGSSLKFCMVAEGSADVYPRLGPTWEWDTAAGHAIVEAAGGRVTDPGGNPLGYNKPTLKHEGFVAAGAFTLAPPV